MKCKDYSARGRASRPEAGGGLAAVYGPHTGHGRPGMGGFLRVSSQFLRRAAQACAPEALLRHHRAPERCSAPLRLGGSPRYRTAHCRENNSQQILPSDQFVRQIAILSGKTSSISFISCGFLLSLRTIPGPPFALSQSGQSMVTGDRHPGKPAFHHAAGRSGEFLETGSSAQRSEP
jgi:hypothetical protein